MSVGFTRKTKDGVSEQYYDKTRYCNIRFQRGTVKLSKKIKVLMEHFYLGEFNRGQSSKLIRGLSEKDTTAFILKNGKPIAVVLSYERYERLLATGVDINEY